MLGTPHKNGGIPNEIWKISADDLPAHAAADRNGGAAGYEVVVDFSEQSARGETITYVSEEHQMFLAKRTTYPQEDQYGTTTSTGICY